MSDKQIPVYAISWSHFATGGIQLLHQLLFQLNKNPLIDAKMLYRIWQSDILQPEKYTQKYNTKYTVDFSIIKDSVVIYPEIFGWLSNLESFKAKLPIIFWESVDNYYPPTTPDKWMYKFPQNAIHLYQSEYAKDFILDKLNISNQYTLRCTDYLAEAYFEPRVPKPRRDTILYNPAKLDDAGLDFIRALAAAASPVKNMTEQQVIDLMDESKLYIDFGTHPGKDRMPREAAMRGCCVIVGKRGAAAKPQGDVLIPETYKFNYDKKEIPKIKEQINHILLNYQECNKDFEQYRNSIRREKQDFQEEVKILGERIIKNYGIL